MWRSRSPAETSTSTQTPSFPIVSQPLAGSPTSFHMNDSSGERIFEKVILLLFCCVKPGQMLLTQMWWKDDHLCFGRSSWKPQHLRQDKVYSADLNRAKIKTNTQMTHSFVHFARTFFYRVRDTQSQTNCFSDTRWKKLASFSCHLISQANKLGLFIPSDSFLRSNADQTCCLLTWLRESLFISAINPKRKGHKAPCTTVVMNSLWKCYPSALNPSATCCKKASTLLNRSPLKQTNLRSEL